MIGQYFMDVQYFMFRAVSSTVQAVQDDLHQAERFGQAAALPTRVSTDWLQVGHGGWNKEESSWYCHGGLGAS